MIEMLHFLSNAGSDAGARLRACLFACLCLAFVAAAPAQQISLRQYAQGDGLLNLSIHQMLVDPAGDIWVATDGGLFRFDGTRFDGYDRSRGIPAGAVNSIAQSPSGRIVARMDEGLYIGGAGGFELLRTATGPVQSDEYTSLVATRDDTVFFVRGQQLYVAQQTSVPGRWQVRPVFNANTLARFPDLARVAGVTATAAGAVWFGCGMGICSYADGGVAFWDGSRGVLPGEYNELLATHGGRLWARSADHIVVRDPGAQQFVLRDPPGGALVNGVNRPLLVADAMSRVVTRTATGLARWQGAQWQTFSRADGLPEQTITSAVADRDGGFWLGAAGVGMFRWLGYDNLESWTQAQGLKQGSVWFMLRDDQHRLILGTDAGCQMLDESARRVVPCPFRGLPVEQASTGARGPDGSLWFAFQYSGQLWRVPPGSVQAERYQGLPANFKPNFMLFDHRDGNAWIAAKEHGVVRMDGRTHRLQFIVPPDGARVNDFTVNFDGSTLWLATSAGLFRYRGGQFLRIATDADGIGSSVATVETRFDGEVWAWAEGVGLLRIPAGDTHVQWVGPPALDHVVVYSLYADRRGWLWANTDQGEGLYDGTTWRLMDVSDGLVWNDTEQDAFFPDDDGSVWIGTSNGLQHIKDPQAWVAAASRPLALHVAAAMLGSTDLLHLPARDARLQWRPNAALDVSFGSRSFDRSPSTELRYRLLGLSPEWYDSKTFDLHIPALLPGEYALEAVAVDPRHERTSPVVRVAFTVVPPWWRSTLVQVLAVVLAACAVVALLAWQARRHEYRQRALEREHRERQMLLERATRDALTGLWNRATIVEFLEGEIDRARITSLPLAVALLDVDHFKHINDTFGHDGGDSVLRALARRLQESLRSRDSIGRYGGEELLIVMPGLPEEDRGAVMDAVRESLCSLPFTLAGIDLRVTVSVGVAWLESPSESSSDLIRRADAALYRAKAAGRNQVVCATGTSTEAVVETTASRRYLKELIERVRRDSARGAGQGAGPEADPPGRPAAESKPDT